MTEPFNVAPEAQFQRELLSAARHLLDQAGYRYLCVPQFGLDACFFIQGKHGNYLRLLEAKCYAGHRPNAVGFGTGNGLGAQVDLLLSPPDSLDLLHQSVRWVLVDSTRQHGSARYAFFDSKAAQHAATGATRGGGVARGKQNNFSVGSLHSTFETWAGLLNKLSDFLLADGVHAHGQSNLR